MLFSIGSVASAAFIALWLSASAHAGEVPEGDVRHAMLRAEKLLAQLEIDVGGYADGHSPPAERVPPDHPYLQGNDGGYVGGRIYVNAEAAQDCLDLTLLHEVVHDATARFRLFATVSNRRIVEAYEALADTVVAAAAAEPYRPRCMPGRRFEMSEADLARLAFSVAPQ